MNLQLMSFRKVAIALVAACLALAGLVAIEPAPEANAAPSNCPSGSACVYTDANYSGRQGSFSECINNFLDYGINDSTSSAYNKGNHDVVWFYEGRNASGAKSPKLERNKELTRIWDGWNDRISSGYFNSLLPYAGKARCN